MLSSDFCSINEVVNKSFFFFKENGFISILSPTSKGIYAKILQWMQDTLDLWTDVKHRISEPWLFWRLKNLVQYGWPPKNNLKPSTYVTTETNCGVCCQIKCTVFGEKMYCFAKRTWTDIFLKKTCGQQAHKRCSTLLNNREMQIKTMRFHAILIKLASIKKL